MASKIDRNHKVKNGSRNCNHPPASNKVRKGKNYENKSFHHKLVPKLIPRWKLILLRHAYDDDHMVKFSLHNGLSYQREDDSKPYYNLKCLNPTDYRQKEVKEIADIFQQWMEDVMIKRMDSDRSNDLWISIRYGSLYLTQINPKVDTMPVEQFKLQFNGILRWKHHKRDSNRPQHQFSTGFFPVYNNFPTEIQSLEGGQFTLDNEIERFRVLINSEDSSTIDYVEYDAQMELIKGCRDEKYVKLDIKDNLSANDVRLCINGIKEDYTENLPTILVDIMNDSSPPFLRDSNNDRMIVKSKYANCVGSLRFKKIKSYKLSTEVQLWDEFRQATSVKLSHIIEYLNLDQHTGQFKDINEKKEIHIEVHSLKQLLNDHNCQLLADNLHRLIFTILPRYLSGNN